ncbi:MAG: pitrilysin family protein, partial [Chthoniobacteraceae bacterium]
MVSLGAIDAIAISVKYWRKSTASVSHFLSAPWKLLPFTHRPSLHDTMHRLIPVALLSLLLSARADVDRTKKPEPGPAPEAAFPDYVTKVLPNGLKVFVIEDDRKPTITLRLVIKAGDALDGDKPGTADFVASLLNRGTETRDALAFAKAVDSLGATLEAAAGPDSTSVSTSGLTKFTDPLLDLFADAVIHPVFAQEQFAKAQKRTYSSLIAQKKEPHSLVGKLMNVTLFGGHPYGKFPTPESVKSITRDDLVKFHSAWFAPNNASLAIVGDVKAADILPKIEKALGAWARKEIPAIKKQGVEPIHGITIHLLDLPGSVQSNVIVCRGEPSRADNPDVPELNVMNSILGGGFSGRLFQNLREKHGYTYGSSSAFGYNKDAGWFQATAETRNNVTAPAITEILGEIKRIMTDPVAGPELELQRQYNIGNYLLSL